MRGAEVRGSGGAGGSANPGPSPLAPPPRAARSCRGAATRWQQTLCDRAAGGSARRGRGAGLGCPPATRPGSRVPSSSRPPGLCRPWQVTQAAEESAPTPVPSPRAAPSGGCSRHGRFQAQASRSSWRRPGTLDNSSNQASRAAGAGPPRG